MAPSSAAAALLLMRLAAGVREMNHALQAHFANDSMSSVGGGAARASLAFSATVYNVEKDNKFQAGRENLKNAAAYLKALLYDRDAIIVVPEASTELLWELWGLLPDHERVHCLYEVIGSQIGKNREIYVGTGLALLYTSTARLTRRTPCNPTLEEQPDYLGMQLGVKAEGLPGKHQAKAFWKWLNDWSSCKAKATGSHRVLSRVIDRPMIGARFAMVESGSELAVVAVHTGHKEHHERAGDDLSDSEKIAGAAADMMEGAGLAPLLIIGDMNTPGGIITPVRSRESWEEFIHVADKKKKALQATFDLGLMQADLEAAGVPVAVVDSKPDDVPELVTCCCPPKAPWYRLLPATPYVDKQGQTCGGTTAETPPLGIVTTDWRKAFQESEEWCEEKRRALGDDVWWPGGHNGEMVVHRCQGSNGFPPEYVESVAAEDKGTTTYEDEAGDLHSNSFLAQYKFDHIIVGAPDGCTLTTTSYGMVQLERGGSDHFPLQAELRVDCA